jgi:uncharacterized membrane protein (UPF0127 family)
MKRYAFVLFVALLALAGCGSDDSSPQAAGTATEPTAATPLPDPVQVRVGDATVTADVADDDAERSLGLGQRKHLGRDAGMYFVLTNASPTFWMKGMLIPLDMIWIKDGRVVDVSARVPKPRPGTPESELPIYSPDSPADRVLEVNSGWAQRNGVERGDRVRLSKAPGG